MVPSHAQNSASQSLDDLRDFIHPCIHRRGGLGLEREVSCAVIRFLAVLVQGLEGQGAQSKVQVLLVIMSRSWYGCVLFHLTTKLFLSLYVMVPAVLKGTNLSKMTAHSIQKFSLECSITWRRRQQHPFGPVLLTSVSEMALYQEHSQCSPESLCTGLQFRE